MEICIIFLRLSHPYYFDVKVMETIQQKTCIKFVRKSPSHKNRKGYVVIKTGPAHSDIGYYGGKHDSVIGKHIQILGMYNPNVWQRS